MTELAAESAAQSGRPVTYTDLPGEQYRRNLIRAGLPRPVLTTTPPFRSLLKVRSMCGMVLAFAGYNFAAYAIGTFLSPVLQRYYGLSLVGAGAVGGVVGGVVAVGLLTGGRVLDRAARKSPATRVRVPAFSLAGAAVFSLAGLTAGQGALWQLVVFLSLGYLLGIVYLAAAVPVVSDVIRPEQRSGELGLTFAIGYLLSRQRRR